MKSNHMISLLYLISLIVETLQQKIITLDTNTTGSLEQDKYDFYQLEILEGTKVNTSTLLIKINGEPCDGDKCEFFDPDVYVSMTNKEPKNYFTSTWWADSYGPDYILISPDKVVEGKQFYIGVYCQFKCKYILRAELSTTKEFEIEKAGEPHKYSIPKESFLYLKYKPKDDFKELIMAFFSSQIKSPYRVFISNTPDPSSSNTFKVQPSFIGGYVLNIHKGTDQYYPNQYYYILILAGDSEVNIQVTMIYPEEEQQLSSQRGSLSFVEKMKTRCYQFPMSQYKQEKVIINLMLFSGTTVLHIGGLRNVQQSVFDNITEDVNTHLVTSDTTVVLTSHDIEVMKRQTTDHSALHFCIYGKAPSSFFVKAHFDTDIESWQKRNFQFVGTSQTDYLPKGKITKYRLIDFTQDTDLTISLDLIEGEAVLYGYFSSDLRNFELSPASLASHPKEILESYETFSGNELNIPNASNKCLSTEGKQAVCNVYAIVSCEGDDDCLYRLRTSNFKEKTTLIPRTVLYNILALNKSDYYHIYINDDSVTLLSVVINTISGETLLRVNYTSPDGTNKRYYTSNNKGYLPNVINVSPTRVKAPNIKGAYIFEVHANSFATYSIYYYTHSKDFDYTKPDWSGVTLKLETGQIIQEIFQKDIQYKIFSYVNSPSKGKDRDIIITLTRKNVYCSFFVFTDLNKFVYDNKTENYKKINGSTWESGWDDELIISKSDKNYLKSDTYYIVVARHMTLWGVDRTIDGIESFSLGVTDEDTDFILYEGVHHIATLKESYTKQGYWYTHNSTDKPFSLAVNTYYGSVNVYIDFKRITPERISKEEEFFYSNQDHQTDFITISETNLKTKCGDIQESCAISIFIEQKSFSAAQYLVIAKSGRTRTEYLPPGVIVPNTIQVGEKHHFIIEEYDKENPGSVYVNFREGQGRVYLTFTKELYPEEKHFPSATHYEFKGEDNYHGQLITLPNKTLENCIPCKYLVTVIGEQLDYMNNMIKYTIIYNSFVQKLTLNVTSFDFITKGYLKYYQFYVGKNAKNVYVTMYNLNGDAALYLNPGELKPTFKQHEWHSSNPSNEFIELTPKESYFVNKGIPTLNGTYTVLVSSDTNTTYNIYVTDQPTKILPIGNNRPASCNCAKDGECRFKMDRIADTTPEKQDITVVLTTNFNYGGGYIYANLLKETNENTFNKFPTPEKYDFSSLKKKKMNYLKVNIEKDNEKLTRDSTLLLTVKCIDKSMFTINAAQLHNSTVMHLDAARENMLYLKEKDSFNKDNTKLLFFNYQDKDISYEVYGYTGKGKVKVYQNYTVYNNKTGQLKYEYNHIAQFDIESSTPYRDTIRYYSKAINKYIYFEVTPQTDLGFYVKLDYDEERIQVKKGRIDSYVVNNDVFNGYFDLYEGYDEVVLSVRCETPNVTTSVYVKVNTLKANEPIGADNKVDSPNEKDDLKGSTSTFLSSVSVLFDSTDNPASKDKFIRVVFRVKLTDTYFSNSGSKIIDILVTSEVNKYKRISARPKALYFAKYNTKKGKKTLFDITKFKKEDDIIVVDISPCEGKIEVKLFNEISYFEALDKNAPIQHIKETEDKINVVITNSTSDNYYMSVEGSRNPGSCSPKEDCKVIEFLMYYYTTTSADHARKATSINYRYEDLGKGRVRLFLPEFRSSNSNSQSDSSHYYYEVFVTSESKQSEKMESLCYLSKHQFELNHTNFVYQSTTNSIIVTGLKPNKPCFLSVKATNSRTGEMFVLRNQQINFNHPQGGGFPVWLTVLIILALIAVSGLLVFYFRKYKLFREIYKFESNDVRSMAQLPKSESELKEITQKEKNLKYVPLSDNPSSI